jgi:uncharacterized protein YaaW (UPF0174 family)
MSELTQEKRQTKLLDELAELEWKQWKSWAYAIMDTEKLSKERTDRWLKHHGKQWRELPEDVKDKDREWAEQVLWIVKRHMGIK